MFSFINSESFISITMTDPVPSVLIWAITVGNHAPLIQTVDAIRWNSYISVKAGAGARPFVAAPTPEHCFFTVRVYQMYTVYISPVAFRWMQKGEWTTFTKTHWLPYRTCDTADCIHHQKYCKHICCFPACIVCNTYAMWTISFVHLYKPVRKPCLHWWSNLLSAHLLFLNIIMF